MFLSLERQSSPVFLWSGFCLLLKMEINFQPSIRYVKIRSDDKRSLPLTRCKAASRHLVINVRVALLLDRRSRQCDFPSWVAASQNRPLGRLPNG